MKSSFVVLLTVFVIPFAVAEPPDEPIAPSCAIDACKVELAEGDALGDFSDPLLHESAPTTPTIASHSTRITCHAHVSSLQQLCLHLLPANTKILEISNTSIGLIGRSSFVSLSQLRRLDLQNNKVSVIEDGAFKGLSKLKRLDLSYNNISSLNGSQLEGLMDVVRMKLDHNPLKYLQENLLTMLPSMRLIDVSDTILVCDCRLAWIVKASFKNPNRPFESSENSPRRSGSLRFLGSSPSCQNPKPLRGMKLRKLSPLQMTCNSPSVSVVDIEPGLDQVVFAGDSLRLSCRVSFGDDAEISPQMVLWKRGETYLPLPSGSGGEKSKTYQNDDIIIHLSSSDNEMVSHLEIPQLTWLHSGEWSCLADGRSNISAKSVSVYVIHHNTKYCALNGNKGTYIWPRTVADVKISLPCEGLARSYHRASRGSWAYQMMAGRMEKRYAKHACTKTGFWDNLDTSKCSYISETTRILEHFATTNLSSGRASLLESARTLRNFTFSGSSLRDPLDIFFLSQTVRHYVELIKDVETFHPTAQAIIDIISSTLSFSDDLLQSSESLYKSCSNLLQDLWSLVDAVPSMRKSSHHHLDVYQLSINQQSFAGVSCVWFRKSLTSTERHFKCNTNNYSLLYSIEDDLTDARIRLPSHLFANLSFDSSVTQNNVSINSSSLPSHFLQFYVFAAPKLFSSARSDSWKVTSPVVGLRLRNDEEVKPLDYIFVTLRAQIFSPNIEPVLWDKGDNDTRGSWLKGDCKITRVANSLISFKCSNVSLTNFALLQDMAVSVPPDLSQSGAAFKYSPAAVYVGSSLCCIFLMASIATWAIHHNRICTMGKNKHSFLNTWVALMFLVALYTVGIYQTESSVMCISIGVTLHYLTTCVLLWMIVSVTNLYKKVTKVLHPPPLSPEEEEAPVPPKPVLRFYLVGWGIALILCGISAAVNLHQYRTYSYCFLSWYPSIASFYAPSAALVFILVVFFLLTYFTLRSSCIDYAEATGNTETTELALLEGASPPTVANGDELSLASQTSCLSVSDAQHSPITQLRSHAVTLILFLLTWASGAITAAAPMLAVIPYHTVVFSVMYAVSSSSLGIFIFIFFCFTRTDVMDSWNEFRIIWFSSEIDDETRLTEVVNINNADTPMQPAPINNQILPPSASPCIANSVRSLDSSNTPTNKSSSHSNQAVNKVESVVFKASNALHILNLSSFQENVQFAPEMFYNPKQVGVAKRFFQKQRLKQLMKQNNLEVNRPDSDCNSSTVYKPRTAHVIRSESDMSSYLGALSKVNNTNIHVDFAYSSGKQSAKSLTPELLCILGPAKEPHHWPLSAKYNNEPIVFLQPKHNNLAPPSPLSNSETKSQAFETHSTSPVIYEENFPALETMKQSYPQRCQHSQKRLRKKLPHSRGSAEEREWTEDDEEEELPEVSIKHNSISEKNVPSAFQNDMISFSTARVPHQYSHTSTTPAEFPQNSAAATTLSHPHLTCHYASPCEQMPWLHLLKKRTCDGQELRDMEKNDFYFEAGMMSFSDDLGASDSESTNERVSNSRWLKDVEGFGYGAHHKISFQAESDEDSNSVSTSLIPGVDTSPPQSLPVSDSPFDSPVKKYDTSDNMSLDSESIPSPPLPCAAPSLHDTQQLLCDQSISPVTITPVNTPVTICTPTGNESENDHRTDNHFISLVSIDNAALGSPITVCTEKSASTQSTNEETRSHDLLIRNCESTEATTQSHSEMTNSSAGENESDEKSSISSKETDV